MKDETELPEDLLYMLQARDALNTFLALKGSARKHYLDWIDEAKKEDTRARRIETVANKLAGR
jgi:uncharacterized protein YdeI (YjbR/CyaY-like superfamily)